jgi:BlaI family transcriptional regulator, penicillinase repressor
MGLPIHPAIQRFGRRSAHWSRKVVIHQEEGRAYIYRPAVRRDAARRSALTHILKTFFDNSAEQAVAALLELKGPKLSEAELKRVAQLVDDAKKEGR